MRSYIYLCVLIFLPFLSASFSQKLQINILDDLRDLNATEGSDLIESLRESLKTKGYAHIPNFISSRDASNLADESQNLRSTAFRSTQSHTIYQLSKDESFDDDHVRNRLMSSKKSIIDNAKLPPTSSLNTLYNRSDFKELIRRITDSEQLFISGDDYNSCYLNIYSKGDGLGWHFDNSAFGVNLLLSDPKEGGEFEIDEELTREAGDSSDKFNFKRAEGIIEGRVKVKVVEELKAGSLCLFAGVNSLHRVRSVKEGERVNAIFTFENRPGVKMNAYGLNKFFGR